MKKIFLTAVLTCIGATLLFGNGKQETKATDSGSVQTTLRFSWWGGDERLAATLAVIDQFEKQNPGIKIQPEYGGSSGYTDKLATQLAAGTAPDIVQVDPEAFPVFVNSGINYFIDFKNYKFNFLNFEPNYLNQRINGCFNGKQFGIPTGIAGPAMLVNKDLADKIGIDFTKQYTWNDLLTWGKKVQSYDKNLHLLCADKEYIANLVMFIYAKQLTGKTLIDESTKTFTLTDTQLTEIYNFVKALYDTGVVAPVTHMAAYTGDSIQSDPDWIAGKYVCTLSYISTISVMTAANPSAHYIVGKLPVLPNARNAGWASNCPQVLAISAKSSHIDAALKFLDYFFNNETAMATLACVRSVPPTAKARAICQKNGKLSDLMAQSADIASTYGGIPNDKYSSVQESKQILFDHVEAVGYGAVTVKEAVRDTINLMNSYSATLK